MSKYIFLNQVKDFHREIENDENGRYKSWEYCYSEFCKAREKGSKDLEHLSLHLAFYLASWGMYRGSSFLLKKDYKVHIPVVKEILKKKYNVLAGIKCADFMDNWSTYIELYNNLKDYYSDVRSDVTNSKSDISSTLITKVLMGTLGCVPAYDRFFALGVKSEGVTSGYHSKKSLEKLVEFYLKKENKKVLDKVIFKTEDDDLYPQMKILDMGFWEMGRKIDEEIKKTKKAEKSE